MLPVKDCYNQVLELSTLEGSNKEFLIPSINNKGITFTFEEGRQFGPVNRIGGRVINALLEDNGIYIDCFEDCFEGNGIWSKVFVKDDRLKRAFLDCFLGCYEDFNNVCEIEVLKERFKCFEPEVFEDGLFEKELYIEKTYKDTDCVEIPNYTERQESNHISNLQSYQHIVGNRLCKGYSIEAQSATIKLYERAFEDNVFEDCNYSFSDSLDYVVCCDSVYEYGVFEDGLYHNTCITYLKETCAESDCYTDCMYNLLPIFATHLDNSTNSFKLDHIFCIEENNTYPQIVYDQEGTKFLIDVQSCIESNCRTPLFDDDYIVNDRFFGCTEVKCLDEPSVYYKYINHYSYGIKPFEEGVFEPGVFVDKTLIYSEPYYPTDSGYSLCYRTPIVEERILANFVITDYYNEYIATLTNNEFISNTDCDICYKPYKDDYDQLCRFTPSGKECFVKGAGNSEVAYVLDIGYIPHYGSEISIIYENIPLRSDGSYTHEGLVPKGIKVVILKAISYLDEQIIAIRYGETPSGLTLLRTYGGSALNLNPIDQYVNLEELSISLINIILSGYKDSKECEDNSIGYYLDPQLELIVMYNLDRLSQLLDIEGASPRAGSIPLHLYSYITYEDIYDDQLQQERIQDCFMNNLFEAPCNIFNNSFILNNSLICPDDCFEPVVDNEFAFRLVDNRAIAWLLLAYNTYYKVFNNVRYNDTIETLASYLINEYNPKLSLVRKGWNHSTVYRESLPIDIYETSTNVTVCLSLLRTYDLFRDYKYLDTGADIYEGINYSLFSHKERLFVDNLDDVDYSYESLLYGLWLSKELNKSEAIESILETFKTYSKYLHTDPNIEITDSKGNLITTYSRDDIVAKRFDYLQLLVEDTRSTVPFFINKIKDQLPLHSSLSHIFITQRLLSDLSFNYDNTVKNISYYVPSILLVNKYTNIIHQHINNNIDTRVFTSAISSFCLNESLFNNSLFNIDCWPDVETLLMSRRFVYQKVSDLMPTKFGWFNEKAISPKGNLGKLLITTSKSLANWYVGFNRSLDANNLTTSKNREIDFYGSDYSLFRWDGETDYDYKERIKAYMLREANVSEAIVDTITLFGIDSIVTEPNITSTDSYFTYNYYKDLRFIPDPQDSWISDNYYATSPVIDIHTNYPVTPSIDEYVMEVKSLGVNHFYRSRLQFEGCYDLIEDDGNIEGDIQIRTSNYIPSYKAIIPCCGVYDYNRSTVYELTLDYATSSQLYINVDNEGNLSLSYDKTVYSVDMLLPFETYKVITVRPRYGFVS